MAADVTFHGKRARPGRRQRQRLLAAAAAERHRATGSRSSSACPSASRSIPSELRQNPLRIGLSVDVTVDTSDAVRAVRRGAAPPPAGGVQQSVDGGPQVEARIRQIIAAEHGPRPRASAR